MSHSVPSKSNDKLQRTDIYNVILLNDDTTPMDFVLNLLENFFPLSRQQAKKLTAQIHKKGSAVCAAYPHEIAETKMAQVIKYARQNNYPLRCKTEFVK